jgi:ribosomal protein S12 methylthiotransferase
MDLQAGISARRLARKVGRRLECLVDGREETRAIARSHADSPDIDGLVHIAGAAHLAPGSRVQVLIDTADEHDLHGHLADRPD